MTMHKITQKQKRIVLAAGVVLLLLLSHWFVKSMKQYNPCADPFVLRTIEPMDLSCMIKKDKQIMQKIAAQLQGEQLQIQAVERKLLYTQGYKEGKIKNVG